MWALDGPSPERRLLSEQLRLGVVVAEEVALLAREAGLKAEATDSVEQALREITARVWPAPPRILICGSLYLAGEVLSANGTPPL